MSEAQIADDEAARLSTQPEIDEDLTPRARHINTIMRLVDMGHWPEQGHNIGDLGGEDRTWLFANLYLRGYTARYSHHIQHYRMIHVKVSDEGSNSQWHKSKRLGAG
ncbi:hypothetical protein [Delftia phage PhiW-14]|uniref:Uncharacterized protein n=1 Tax=Delftia phage PhiW-14 TaxID=665032 RepID=C9DGB1_BPW14|nr:hypothetical protein DP-phiW-14_gp141 [Delftia phage PhiW-14]ACV50162.1 hypothetical protein [Delftia phage PhiW-14]